MIMARLFLATLLAVTFIAVGVRAQQAEEEAGGSAVAVDNAQDEAKGDDAEAAGDSPEPAEEAAQESGEDDEASTETDIAEESAETTSTTETKKSVPAFWISIPGR